MCEAHLWSTLHAADVCFLALYLGAGTTRILVTHQRQYLPKCDRVAVLRNGQLVACGPYDQVAALQLPELTGGAVTMSLDVPSEQQQSEVEGDRSASRLPVPTSWPEEADAGDATAAADASSEPGKQQDTASSSSSIGSATEDSSDPDFGGKSALSRIRTMAPDINKRPADSGRLPLQGSSGSIAAANGNSFARIASGMRSFGSGFFMRQQQQPHSPDGMDSPLDHPSRSAESGVLARLKLQVYHGVAGLFTPPAYLPGGIYYSPPPKSTLELQPVPSSVGFRAPSAKGLLSLGPVRSVLAQPSLRFSSSKWLNPAGEAGAASGLTNDNAAAGDAAAVGGKGVSNGLTSIKGSSAGGAPVGQLVAAEGREIGSVAWSVYGQYCRQIGLVTVTLLTVALFAGQGFALAAEWWLALWAASPRAEQSKTR
jgi:hypothetical protein